MRTILHSDLNNFYASVECVENPAFRDIPIAVCGDPEARHGIVLAKNQLAKAAGVITGEAIWQARQKCPGLHSVKPNFRRYLKFARLMRAIYADYTEKIEPFGLDEAWLDVTGHAMSGEAIADELRLRAKEELGLTLSIGVSFNKVFSKLGSDMKKPDATTVITRENYQSRIWPLPAQQLLYVGYATTAKLRRRNIYTIGDIARCPVEILRKALGKAGEMIWSFANGLESSPVTKLGEEAMIKSVGNSTTTPRDISDDADARMVLYLLSESVAERLREHGLRGATVCLSVRDCALDSFVCQHKLSRATAISNEIAQTAFALFAEHYHWDRPVRSLGVSVTSLEPLACDEQLTMFPDLPRERLFEFEGAVADVRRRFGHFALQRAVFITHRDMGAINPKDDHTIHPVGWKAG
ncbi:MAG: DNA polymerase IV [Christensenellales bacterium]|jgi:DNA polymerase-4